MTRGACRALLGAGLAAALLAGCTGSGDEAADRPTNTSTPGSQAPTSAPPVPGLPAELKDPYACRGGFICGGLEVPLDRADPSAATLTLQVALEADPDSSRGVLLALNGGPGAAGAPLAPELVERFGPEVVADYRIVALDQRGTGPSALECPALQQDGATRFVPSADAVQACAASLGDARGHYGTDATVADLDRLREVLGADRLSLFAVSYGTFVAQQYAVAHPRETELLVLDSALPAGGFDTLQRDVVRATPRVLGLACRAARCPGDPVADLAAVVRDGGGVDLLSLLAAMSSARPSYDTLLPALRKAARGDRSGLDRLLEAYRTGFGTTPDVFSAGLNAAASCGDQRFPWGRSDAPLAGRQADVRREVASAGPLYPFDGAAVSDALAQCLAWPPVAASKVELGKPELPGVRVLFVSGDRDLSAPVESVRGEADRAADGTLVVIRGAGHVVTARPGRGREVVQDFLLR